MQFSKQLFGGALRAPKNHASMPTGELLASGFALRVPYRGVACFLPIGQRVLSAMESILLAEAEEAGFSICQPPTLVRNEDMKGGEPIGETFQQKFIGLRPPFADHHLLATPEMMLARFANAGVLSHNGLPIRLSYSTDFFRNMPATRSFLTCRQFRVFGLLSIEKDERGVEETSLATRAVEARALSAFGVAVATRQVQGGFETDHLPDGAADRPAVGGNRRPMLIAMGYHYGRNIRLPLRYRTRENRNAPVQVFTYGLSLYRAFHAIFDACRDDLGFRLPRALRPFHLVIVPSRGTDIDLALRLYAQARAAGLQPGLDDRLTVPRPMRRAFASYLGAPLAVEVREGCLWFSHRGRPGEMAAAGPERFVADVAAHLAPYRTDLAHPVAPDHGVCHDT